MKRWEEGWETLFRAIAELTVEDIGKSIEIRGEPHTVVEALNRQLSHYAYHIGQITFLAKHFRSEEWQTLSVPKNRSEDFNRFLSEKRASGLDRSHPLEGPQEFARYEEEKSKK